MDIDSGGFSLIYVNYAPVIPVLNVWLLSWVHNGREIDGLVQERLDSSALAVELRLSCFNPSKCKYIIVRTIFVRTKMTRRVRNKVLIQYKDVVLAEWEIPLWR